MKEGGPTPRLGSLSSNVPLGALQPTFDSFAEGLCLEFDLWSYHNEVESFTVSFDNKWTGTGRLQLLGVLFLFFLVVDQDSYSLGSVCSQA